MSGILSDVTTERWMQRERKLAEDVGRLAINSKSIEVNSPENLVVRDILPNQDLDQGDHNDWTSNEEWRQDWDSDGNSSAATATAYNQAYQIDSSANAEDKIIGLMGLSALHAGVDTRQVRFNMGAAGNQGVKREFNMESLETDREGRAMFLTDVIFDAKEHGTIEHYVDALSDNNRIVYHGYVAEAVGETVAEASNPLLASGGGNSNARRGGGR